MKRFGFALLAIILCLGLTVSGCTSAQKKLSEEVKGVKSRVDTLETRIDSVEAKQTETERIAMEQVQKVEELKSERVRPSPRTNLEIKHRRSFKDKEKIREVQRCLKNAGFYQGNVDGVKGRKTRAAIRKFQSANGLAVDGVVGNKTWEALSKYSSGGAAQSGAEEEAPTK